MLLSSYAHITALGVLLLLLLCVDLQVPSLVTCVTLRDEVAMLAELLAPLANPQLAGTFRKALLDIFLAATQVGVCVKGGGSCCVGWDHSYQAARKRGVLYYKGSTRGTEAEYVGLKAGPAVLHHV